MATEEQLREIIDSATCVTCGHPSSGHVQNQGPCGDCFGEGKTEWTGMCEWFVPSEATKAALREVGPAAAPR